MKAQQGQRPQKAAPKPPPLRLEALSAEGQRGDPQLQEKISEQPRGGKLRGGEIVPGDPILQNGFGPPPPPPGPMIRSPPPMCPRRVISLRAPIRLIPLIETSKVSFGGLSKSASSPLVIPQ